MSEPSGEGGGTSQTERCGCGERIVYSPPRFNSTTLRQKRWRLSRPPAVELHIVVSQTSSRLGKTSGFDWSRASKWRRPAAVKGCGGASRSIG